MILIYNIKNYKSIIFGIIIQKFEYVSNIKIYNNYVKQISIYI